MRNLCLFLVIAFGSLQAIAQDTTKKVEKPVELEMNPLAPDLQHNQQKIKSQTYKVLLPNIDYQFNQLKSIKKQFQPQSVHPDPSEDNKKVLLGVRPVPNAIHPDITEDQSENRIKRRLISGPSQYDSRVELRSLDPTITWEQKVINNSSSVAIVIEKNQLHRITDSVYQLDIGATFGMMYKLCEGEPFANEPVIGVGTAFITNRQQMITAAHVFTGKIENYVIVFGYEIANKAGAFNSFIPAANIYYPKKIVQQLSDLDLDIFSVDRPFNRLPLKFSSSIDIAINTPVYMIGYPCGLPQKVALNASVQANDSKQYLITTLDSFEGNSGSPVFRLDTHELIGVLVSGEVDLNWNGSCNISNLCKIPYCNGEKVIRIALIQDYIQ